MCKGSFIKLIRGLILACALMVGTQARSVSPLPGALGDMTAWRALSGQAMYFLVTGKTSGSVWGSGPYTDDSNLATAAVHAGLVGPDQTAVIKVTVMPGQSSYVGSTAHGVTSGDYSSYTGSFSLAADDGGNNPVLPAPYDLTAYRNGVLGGTYLFTVTGTTTGSVWGTNAYTDDSTLASVAVHAGVLKDGQQGTVRVVLVPGLANYTSSTRSGITSSSYGNWDGSYAVSDPAGATPLAAYPGMQANPLPDPYDMSAYTQSIGGVFYVTVTGTTSGAIWGTGLYTSDSHVATAAVHAGVLSAGQTGEVKVSMLPGQASYTSSTAHGITSSSYGNWNVSYSVSQPDGSEGSIPLLSSATTASASSGHVFNYAMTATPPAAAFNATGLPEGLSVDIKTGVISGTPMVSGVFRVDLLTGSAVGTSSATLVLSIDNYVPTTADLNSFFSWAEATAGSLLAPAGQTTVAQNGYYFRYYPSTRAYLGVAGDGVLYSGPLSGGYGLNIGSFLNFLATAKAAGY